MSTENDCCSYISTIIADAKANREDYEKFASMPMNIEIEPEKAFQCLQNWFWPISENWKDFEDFKTHSDAIHSEVDFLAVDRQIMKLHSLQDLTTLQRVYVSIFEEAKGQDLTHMLSDQEEYALYSLIGRSGF